MCVCVCLCAHVCPFLSKETKLLSMNIFLRMTEKKPILKIIRPQNIMWGVFWPMYGVQHKESWDTCDNMQFHHSTGHSCSWIQSQTVLRYHEQHGTPYIHSNCMNPKCMKHTKFHHVGGFRGQSHSPVLRVLSHALFPCLCPAPSPAPVTYVPLAFLCCLWSSPRKPMALVTLHLAPEWENQGDPVDLQTAAWTLLAGVTPLDQDPHYQMLQRFQVDPATKCMSFQWETHMGLTETSKNK